MWLFEQPLIVLFVGAIFVAVAAVFWVQTQQPRALAALAFSVLALAGALAIEYMVVTPAEEVEQVLADVALALEANDPERVASYLASSAEELRQEVRSRLRMVTVRSISIKSNLRVTVVGQSSAEARFNAVATLAIGGGNGGEQVVPRFLVVRFRREQGAWRIVDYEQFDPRGPQAGR
jgi:hypothetical protein